MKSLQGAALISSAALLFAGCTSSGQTERYGAGGAAAGAAIGALAADDSAEGALIGGAIGGAAGALTGCWDALDCDVPGANDPYDPRLEDRSEYYEDRYERSPYDAPESD